MPNIILIRNTYPDEGALYRVIYYALRDALNGGYAIDPAHAYTQMQMVKKAFYKTEGIQLKHFIISFSDSEMAILDFDDILNLGFQVGLFFREYQMVYGIHLDSGHIHMHVVMNTVSFIDGHKYSGGITQFSGLCRHLRVLFPKFRTQLYCTERYNYSNPYTQQKKGNSIR